MKILAIPAANSVVSAPATSAQPPALTSDELSQIKNLGGNAAPAGLDASTAGQPAPLQGDAAPNPHRIVINGEGLGVQFSTDPVTDRMVIRLVDTKSGELVRQIPSEEVLNYLRQLEAMKGKIFSRSL